MVGISASYYSYVKSKIYTEFNEIKIKTVDKKSEDEVNYKEVEGITNVLLVGTDGRDVNEKARADSIIIATLDNNNKEIRLTSLFRDTLVDIEGYGPHKLNAAMAFGGIDLLKEERPCMFFSADNMLGVKDTKHFYIYDTESKQEFNYNIHNGTLSPATANTTFDSLKTYAFSMLQTTEYLIRKQLTTDKPHSNP